MDSLSPISPVGVLHSQQQQNRAVDLKSSERLEKPVPIKQEGRDSLKDQESSVVESAVCNQELDECTTIEEVIDLRVQESEEERKERLEGERLEQERKLEEAKREREERLEAERQKREEYATMVREQERQELLDEIQQNLFNPFELLEYSRIQNDRTAFRNALNVQIDRYV